MIIEETLKPERGTLLRQNGLLPLYITVDSDELSDIFLINNTRFLTQNLEISDFEIKPENYYMVVNKKDIEIKVKYNHNVKDHGVIYDPYKFEHNKKRSFNVKSFEKAHEVPEGYSDILNKWYSIKFTYPSFNLIFIKPEMGISIQVHELRYENWEVLEGRPIILNGNNVYYYVKKGTKFENKKQIYHSIINPNKNPDDFVVIKEEWGGYFDEQDIKRIYNPNHYY